MVLTDRILVRTVTFARWCILLTILVTGVLGRPLITARSIGNAVDSGSQWITGETFEMRGCGAGLGASDNIIFASGELSGNCDIRTRCAQIIDTNTLSEAGLMLRTDTLPGSPFCALSLLQERGTVVKYRSVSGGDVRTVTISSIVFDHLRIRRTGTAIEFFYRSHIDSIWLKFPTAYTFSFPASLCAGIYHSSRSASTITSSRFDLFEGFSEEPVIDPSCDSLLYDFESGESLDELGFRNIHNWVYDSSGIIRTIVPPDSIGNASILSHQFAAELARDTVSIAWDLYLAGDTMPPLFDFSVFSAEQMTLGDRVKIQGHCIGSASGMEVGVEDSLIGSIRSAGNVILKDRSRVFGDVQAGGTCTLLSDASVSGVISQHAAVGVPVIPVQIVDTGMAAISVAPNDSVYLAPGSYSTVHAFGNAKVSFAPGVYRFAALITEPDVKLYMNTDTLHRIELSIRKKLQIGDRTKMYMSDSSAQKNISIYTHQSDTVTFGADLLLSGYFLLPNAEAKVISRSCVIRGGLYARKIRLEPDVRLTILPSPARTNRFDISFIPVNTSEQTQHLSFVIHRSADQNMVPDFILKSGTTVMATAVSGEPTPLARTLHFTMRVFQADSGMVSRLLYHNGTGTQVIFNSVPFPVSSLEALACNYYQENLTNHISASLDNISISCTADPCPPLILLSNPSDTTVYEHASALFTCSVDAGSSVPVFQWYCNGSAVPWTNSPVFRMQNVGIEAHGTTVYCRVSGACDDVVTSTATLTVLECAPPLISVHPRSDTVMLGQSISFFVRAQGSGLQYQWKRNNQDIPGEESDSCIISRVVEGNNLDEYQVVVKNGCGKWSRSNSAYIVIRDLEPCRITQHPRSDTLMEEEYYRTDVQTICPNGEYTWFRNGLPLPGIIGKELIYGPVSIADNGSEYFCVIDNGITRDTSSRARLMVISPRETRSAVAISGELLDGNGNVLGKDDSVFYNFKVLLYTALTGGASLYSEEFRGKRVCNGLFTVTLGQGKASGDLQKIVAAYKELYAEMYAGKDGTYELVAPRLRITAAPYAFTSGIKVIYGDGVPDPSVLTAPLGTMYIDKADSNSTWKLGELGWVKLD